jgi:hypothetical protein
MQEASESRARIVGSPGERARFAGLVRTAIPLLIGAAAGGYLVRAAAPWPPLSAPAAGLLILALAAALSVAVPACRKRFSSFFKGARGEELVARELASLPAGFTVLHGVRVPGASPVSKEDCDHVVVGPPGVFLVETKNWSGRVTVAESRLLCDGREPSRPPLAQARSGAALLGRELSARCGLELAVNPVLCFATARLPAGPIETDGVTICDVVTVADVVSRPSGCPLPADSAARAAACLGSLLE